ncbi:hypothetical protein EUGRSUZ_C03761 [Eucalyptus grandis]|uniref:Uncharacterized protein n=2 Tax=Eucalyptus grandis TaxID=71139 RepID=A0ACC3LK02_EUCGR|nr:hypothetical protein EUGRSUZ_C03761 [Eucalyptus grandis]
MALFPFSLLLISLFKQSYSCSCSHEMQVGFFVYPNHDCLVECLLTCTSEENLLSKLSFQSGLQPLFCGLFLGGFGRCICH